MQCPNCKHENNEGVSFCEKCGAQLVEEKKRMSLFERRQAKEKERQYVLSKASLQESDLVDVKDLDMGEVEVTAVSSKSKLIKTTAVKFALSLLLVALCIILIFVIGKFKFNDTLRVALIFVVFVLCSVGGAFATDNGYKLRMIKAMCKSPFAVKKIGYGKPPYMLIGDTFYQLAIKSSCDVEGCGASMHIEEYNGEFIAVCDADRGHLRRLDCSLLNKNNNGGAQKDTAQSAEDGNSNIFQSEVAVESADDVAEEKKVEQDTHTDCGETAEADNSSK